MRVRAVKGDLTGPSPVDRGRPGSKIHAVGDRGGIPLTVVVSAANRDDHLLLDTAVDAFAQPACAVICYRRADKLGLLTHNTSKMRWGLR